MEHQVRLQIELLLAHVTFDPFSVMDLHHMPRLLVIVLESGFADLTHAVASDSLMFRINVGFPL